MVHVVFTVTERSEWRSNNYVLAYTDARIKRKGAKVRVYLK